MKAIRDEQGRFTKRNEDSDTQLTIPFPKLSTCILWSFMIIVLLPWIIIVYKAALPGKLFNFITGMLIDQIIPQNTGAQAEDNGGYWSKK